MTKLELDHLPIFEAVSEACQVSTDMKQTIWFQRKDAGFSVSPYSSPYSLMRQHFPTVKPPNA